MPTNANNVNSLSYIQSGNNYTDSSPNLGPDKFRSTPSPYMGYSFPSSSYILLQARQVSFANNTLGSSTHIYTSPVYTDITNLAKYFADWCCSYTIQEGAVHTITVSVPWDTMTETDWNISLFASEQWELVPSQGSKELKHSGLIGFPFQSIGSQASQLTLIPDYMKVAIDQAKKNDTQLTVNSNGLTSAQVTEINKYLPCAQQILLYNRMGVEGIPMYTQTLKRTAVIDKRNKNNAFNLAADNVQNSNSNLGSINYLLSTQSLISSYQLPIDGVGKFLLPSYMKKLYVTSVDTLQIWSYAGWLVRPPSFQFIGKNKVQLTQEFVWNEYLGGLYYIQSPISDFPEVYIPYVP